MVRQWAICLRKPYVQCIVAGVKAYEVRTHIPEGLSVGDEVYVVDAGTEGKVVCSFTVERIVSEAPKNIWEEFKSNLCIYEKDFSLYAGVNPYLYLLIVGSGKIFNPPLEVSDLGWTCVPQWFVRVHIPHSAPSCQ